MVQQNAQGSLSNHELYKAEGGVDVTDDMVDRWDEDADQGVYHGEPGDVIIRKSLGRPRKYAAPMSAVTLRVPAEDLEQATLLAKRQGVSRSEQLRELLTLGIREQQRHLQ